MAAAKRQLKSEIIFLTHNEALHEVNLRWRPKAEEWLWRPDLQQKKLSQNGMWNLRYKVHEKRRHLHFLLSSPPALRPTLSASSGSELLSSAMAHALPSCEIGYAF